MMDRFPDKPKLFCDVCGALRSHSKESEQVREWFDYNPYDFDEPQATGQPFITEIWTCDECGTARDWGAFES